MTVNTVGKKVVSSAFAALDFKMKIFGICVGNIMFPGGYDDDKKEPNQVGVGVSAVESGKMF